ncbi:acetyl-CoA synthetase-like protein [Hymenopellis radicata]|nr:acetyl-CoA synthetase-like protein [Hymenopellis radicata]
MELLSIASMDMYPSWVETENVVIVFASRPIRAAVVDKERDLGGATSETTMAIEKPANATNDNDDGSSKKLQTQPKSADNTKDEGDKDCEAAPIPHTRLPIDYPSIPQACTQWESYTGHLQLSDDEDNEKIIAAALLVLLYRFTGDADVAVLVPSGVARVVFPPDCAWSLKDVLDTIASGEGGEGVGVGVNVLGVQAGLFIKEGEVKVQFDGRVFARSRMELLVEQIQAVLSSQDNVMEISLVTASQATLPDPAADLGWCEWQGAITDVFTRFARDGGDERVCLVDYSGEDVKEYSYAAIHRAARALSRRLEGIKEGDVVMVYAFRGVEMLVCALGILMAGGVLCIVDPAYPPLRQALYVDVAHPKGFVAIERAGKVCQQVWDALGDHVLKVEGLKVEDCEEEEYDAVSLGPDSIATLTFTSGSTGTPKGVQGRHHSLTAFYPFMGSRFGLDSSARFAMLSGIAHDPIQRDLFTPLFFGARLYIPSEATYRGEGGALAGWMKECAITTAHMTPGMAGIMCQSQEGTMPSLRNAFLTGDILTKGDCERVRRLCPNARIINMYGSTETQRAVSYYAIEAEGGMQEVKDVIPAGKGMRGVQLLVVNPTTKRLCGVGEVGEIYVRSGGMSEGYLGVEGGDKFWANWFRTEPIADTLSIKWKGPRDRMYKSGDLGRYLADGNVECSGRKDNLVKIRGYRVELGEVDVVLRACQGVTAAATLVKEGMLVTYYVGEGDVRKWLKERLPAYSVPTHLISLPSLPLNPNGKVDKPALPWPPPSYGEEQGTELEEKVREIWTNLFGFRVPLTTPFLDLGGHSILAPQLLQALRLAFKPLPYKAVYESTVRGCAAFIQGNIPNEDDYTSDVARLLPSIPASFPLASPPKTVFLTGATGYLGGYILQGLLAEPSITKVVCLVRSALPPSPKLHVVSGDLALPRLGLSEADYALVSSCDVLLHNGALVHWTHPYGRVRAANVLSLLELMQMRKRLVFVSSTGTLETPLANGYTQSKWVCEALMRAAQARGMAGCVVRCCYVGGEQPGGRCNTDDFIWRVVKTSRLVGCAPAAPGTLNIVHVRAAAGVMVKAALCVQAVGGVDVTAPSLLSFDDLHEIVGVPLVPLQEYIGRLPEGSPLAPLGHVLETLFWGSPPVGGEALKELLGSEEEWEGMSVTEEGARECIKWLEGVGYFEAEGDEVGGRRRG